MEINGVKGVVPGEVPIQGQKPAEGAPPVPPQVPPPEIEEEEKDPEKLREKLEDGTDKMNKAASLFDRSIKFKYDETSKEMVVRVIDTQTDRVIREIPSKEFLDFVAKMKEYIGMVFDKKA